MINCNSSAASFFNYCSSFLMPMSNFCRALSRQLSRDVVLVADSFSDDQWTNGNKRRHRKPPPRSRSNPPPSYVCLFLSIVARRFPGVLGTPCSRPLVPGMRTTTTTTTTTEYQHDSGQCSHLLCNFTCTQLTRGRPILVRFRRQAEGKSFHGPRDIWGRGRSPLLKNIYLLYAYVWQQNWSSELSFYVSCQLFCDEFLDTSNYFFNEWMNEWMNEWIWSVFYLNIQPRENVSPARYGSRRACYLSKQSYSWWALV